MKTRSSTRPGAAVVLAAVWLTGFTHAASLTIATTNLPARQVNLPYLFQLAARGGTSPYQWSLAAGQLPTGMALVASNGVISGTCSAVGSFNFTARVTDAVSNHADQPLSIIVYPIPPGFPVASSAAWMQLPKPVSALPFATITLDGSTSDWGAIAPAGTDPQGDGATGFPGSDVMALYVAQDNTNLYLRLDLWQNANPGFWNYPPPNQGRYGFSIRSDGANSLTYLGVAYVSSLSQWSLGANGAGSLPGAEGPAFVGVNGKVIELKVPLAGLGSPTVLYEISAAFNDCCYETSGMWMNDDLDIVSATYGSRPDSKAGNELSASAAGDGTNYLVGIGGDEAASDNITAQLVGQSGSLIGPRLKVGRTGGAPLVAFGKTNYLMVWQDDATDPNDDIYGQIVSRSGSLLGAPFPICTATNDQSLGYGCVAFDGTDFLVVWDDGRFAPGAGQGPPYVFGQRVSQGGGLVGGNLQISSTPGHQAGVAFNGTDFLVAWCEQTGNTDICGQLVSPSGALLGGRFAIDTNRYPSDNPLAVASDGVKFLVVFGDEIGGTNWDLFARLVTGAGAVESNRITLSAGPGNQLFPGAIPVGTHYLVGWRDGFGATNASRKARFFDRAGSPRNPEFAMVAGPGPRSPLGSVLFDGNRFVAFATWVLLGQSEGGGLRIADGDVYGQFIAPSLQAVGGRPDGEFHFQLNGFAGQTYTVRTATNLGAAPWAELLTTNAPGNTVELADPQATNASRFYRAKWVW